MKYRTFITGAARKDLAVLPDSTRPAVVRTIDRLESGNFANSRNLPVATPGVRLRTIRVAPSLRVVYAVDEDKQMIAIVRLEREFER